MGRQLITVNLTSMHQTTSIPDHKMDSIIYSNTEKPIVQEKSMGDVQFVEKTSSTDFSDNNTTAGFDGLSDSDCKALEKRRTYLILKESNFD